MIASLPMYDWPEVREATDAFWHGLRRQLGVELPLWRVGDHDAPWHDPQLLFSQTCGYPFTHRFRDQLKYVATPHYEGDGCDGPHYCSFVFARQNGDLQALRGSRAAVNTRESMSGMLALKLVFAPFAEKGVFFSETLMTGGHIASLEAVARGKADVCAIDAVCVAMTKRYRPHLLEGLVEIARSPLVPGLPFVTRAGDVALLQTALQHVFADVDVKDARQKLFLCNHSVISAANYDRILQLEAAMENAGGMHL